jgi:hypothetical protein
MCKGKDMNVMVMDVEGTDGRERGEDQVRSSSRSPIHCVWMSTYLVGCTSILTVDAHLFTVYHATRVVYLSCDVSLGSSASALSLRHARGIRVPIPPASVYDTHFVYRNSPLVTTPLTAS